MNSKWMIQEILHLANITSKDYSMEKIFLTIKQHLEPFPTSAINLGYITTHDRLCVKKKSVISLISKNIK